MRRPSFRSLVTGGSLVVLAIAPVTLAAPAAAVPGAAIAAGTTVVSAGAHPRRPVSPLVMSGRGAGHYRIGASQRALAAAGRLGWVAPRAGCRAVVHAGATGAWAGKIILVFRHGRLVEVGTATTPPRSTAGAAVGMSFGQLERRYGRRGKVISNRSGERAYLVRSGATVELFTGHPIRPGVGYFQVGRADFVLRAFLRGSTC